ncbi:MAG TPA: class I SAM-dependent methyltransferase [Chlamydiales bacterium]|nr:class I SAM-dependent methyltransferase [Chlamydiales bacterium]
MAAVAISVPQIRVRKRRFNVRKDNALAFINQIDSTWKGHEPFAFWLVQRLHPKTIVDLGFDRGLSTITFAYRNRGQVFGIDWFDEGNYASKCFALDTAFQNISNAIRFHYARNIHLIVGPFRDVSKTWKRKIDILHIGLASKYTVAKQHYDNWSRYLNTDGVVLLHDVTSFPNETGRFFNDLPMHKFIFPFAQGLGVASHNEALIEEIRQVFNP